MKIGSSADLAPDWGSSPDNETTQVQAGETLAELASRLGVSPEDLQKANPQISDPDNLPPGSEVRIPSAEVPGPPGSDDAKGTAKASSSYRERNFEASIMKSMLSSGSRPDFAPADNTPASSGGITQMPPVAPGVEGPSAQDNDDLKARLSKVYTAAEKLGISHQDLVSMLHTLSDNRPVTQEMMVSALRLFNKAKDLGPTDRQLVGEAFRKTHADPAQVDGLTKLVGDPKFAKLSLHEKKEWLDKFHDLSKSPELKGLSDTQKSIVYKALASDPPPSADKITKTLDALKSAKDLSPADRKLFEEGLNAAGGDPAYAANLKKLVEDPKFKSLKPAEKTAVLSQTKNYPDARAVGNIDRLLHTHYFQAEGLANKQRSLKMIGKLSSYDGGDRQIIDNTLNKLLDPKSPVKLEWKEYPAKEKDGTTFGEMSDDNVLSLNQKKVPDGNDKLPDDGDSNYLILGTVPHEVNHSVNPGPVGGTFHYFEDEYRAWYVSFKAEHGRVPTNQEAMEQRVSWMLDPKSFYGKYAAAAMKKPQEAAKLFHFLENLTGQKVDAKNWKTVIKTDPATWPNHGQSPAPVPSGNIDNH